MPKKKKKRKKRKKRPKKKVKEIDYKSLVSPMWVENLKAIREDVLKNDFDCFFVVSGYEGNGKSTFLYITLKILNPDHNNDMIYFYKKEWDKHKHKLKKGDSPQFTEGTEFAMSKESMKIEVREFEKEITQWRGRNLFMGLEISDFDMLSKYLRKSRALGLIWIPKRGEAWIYSFVTKTSRDAKRVAETKKLIYRNEFPYPDLKVRFKDVPKEDEEWQLYKKRKAGFMKEDKESKAVRMARAKIMRKLDGSLTLRDIAKIYDVHLQTARNWACGNKYRDMKPKIGKSHLFKDFSGKMRVDKKGVKLLEKRIKKEKGF